MIKRSDVRIVAKNDVPSDVWKEIEQACKGGVKLEFKGNWWFVRGISRKLGANGITPSAKLVATDGP